MTGTKKWWKKYKKGVLGLGALLILIVVALVVYSLRDMPNPAKLKLKEYPESSQIFDRNGKLLYLFYSDKRRILREYSIKDEIREFVSVLADEIIVYDEDKDFLDYFKGGNKTIVMNSYPDKYKEYLIKKDAGKYNL